MKIRKARTKSVLQPNPEESSEGEEITIDGCGPVQEHSEPAKPAREHVPTIDGKIQMWLPDTNLVTSKHGKAATCACIPAFVGSPDPVPRVNLGFIPI